MENVIIDESMELGGHPRVRWINVQPRRRLVGGCSGSPDALGCASLERDLGLGFLASTSLTPGEESGGANNGGSYEVGKTGTIDIPVEPNCRGQIHVAFNIVPVNRPASRRPVVAAPEIGPSSVLSGLACALAPS